MSYQDYPVALAAKDPCTDDSDCDNIFCKIGKGIKKHITGECTALDPKKLEARDKALTTPTPGNVDADCNTYGPFAFLCVAGKSITKGGQGIGKWLSNPLLLAGAAIAVIIVLVLVLKVKL